MNKLKELVCSINHKRCSTEIFEDLAVFYVYGFFRTFHFYVVSFLFSFQRLQAYSQSISSGLRGTWAWTRMRWPKDLQIRLDNFPFIRLIMLNMRSVSVVVWLRALILLRIKRTSLHQFVFSFFMEMMCFSKAALVPYFFIHKNVIKMYRILNVLKKPDQIWKFLVW